MSKPASEPSALTAAVVGGGPAGLMAAEVLAQAGAAVTVFEHKRSMGRKFLLAGRGGLNITHSEPVELFTSRYGALAPQLESALEAFGPSQLRTWCEGLGETTFVGSSGRVFPKSFRATPLLRAWLKRLASQGVQFKPQHRWVGFSNDTPTGLRFETNDGAAVEVQPDVTVVAVGGASWPRVGSDGTWAEPFANAGVAVAPLQSANCGVQMDWHPAFAMRFQGKPLKNVTLTVNGSLVRGDCVVTQTGLEGGPVYAHSSAVRQQIALHDAAQIVLDLQPDLTAEQLTVRLSKRRPKDSASTWLRGAKVAPIAVGVLREVTGNQLPNSAEEMAALMKAAPLRVRELAPLDRSISTAGGVYFDEMDDQFMLRSRPGVFLAGEMLDWDAPTGGYLLQACFSTGVAAARGAMAWTDT